MNSAPPALNAGVAADGGMATTGNAASQPGAEVHAEPTAQAEQALAPAESVRLSDLETVIRNGLDTFMEVGSALMEIRNSRLYRATHGSFQAYCRERWQMTDRRARQLMAAAETIANLEVGGTIVPITESQARPLAALPPEQQQEAWTRARSVAAAEGRPVTAKDTQAAADAVAGRRNARAKRIHKAPATKMPPRPTSGSVHDWEETLWDLVQGRTKRDWPAIIQAMLRTTRRMKRQLTDRAPTVELQDDSQGEPRTVTAAEPEVERTSTTEAANATANRSGGTVASQAGEAANEVAP
jgi:hypothetical protein